MKRFLKVLLAVSLMVGVAHAKKVMLFDLSKHELQSKNKNKYETYKIGDITLKTDLQYHGGKEPYHTFSRIKIIMPSYEGIMFYFASSALFNDNNSLFMVTDDFGEIAKIEFAPSRRKIMIKDQVIYLYDVYGKEIEHVSAKHLDGIKEIIIYPYDRNTELHDFKIIQIVNNKKKK